MEVFSNREVFLFGKAQPDGIWADAVWLKRPDLTETPQELWHNKKPFASVVIPKDTGQVHTEILLPYAEETPLANQAEAAHRN